MSVKINFNFSDKFAYSLMFVLAIAIFSFGVYAYTQAVPNPGHGGDTVLISVGGSEKTLQNAIDDGNLGGSPEFQIHFSENCESTSGDKTCAIGSQYTFCSLSHSYVSYEDSRAQASGAGSCAVQYVNNQWQILAHAVSGTNGGVNKVVCQAVCFS